MLGSTLAGGGEAAAGVESAAEVTGGVDTASDEAGTRALPPPLVVELQPASKTAAPSASTGHNVRIPRIALVPSTHQCCTGRADRSTTCASGREPSRIGDQFVDAGRHGDRAVSQMPAYSSASQVAPARSASFGSALLGSSVDADRAHHVGTGWGSGHGNSLRPNGHRRSRSGRTPARRPLDAFIRSRLDGTVDGARMLNGFGAKSEHLSTMEK